GGARRWPAQCAGLVGLRPTVGRVSRAGEQPPGELGDEVPRSFQDTVQVVGPIGRSVDDVFTVLRVISVPDGGDPLVADELLRDYRDVRLNELEVAWAPTVAEVAVDPEIAEAVAAAGAAPARRRRSGARAWGPPACARARGSGGESRASSTVDSPSPPGSAGRSRWR